MAMNIWDILNNIDKLTPEQKEQIEKAFRAAGDKITKDNKDHKEDFKASKPSIVGDEVVVGSNRYPIYQHMKDIIAHGPNGDMLKRFYNKKQLFKYLDAERRWPLDDTYGYRTYSEGGAESYGNWWITIYKFEDLNWNDPDTKEWIYEALGDTACFVRDDNGQVWFFEGDIA